MLWTLCCSRHCYEALPGYGGVRSAVVLSSQRGRFRLFLCKLFFISIQERMKLYLNYKTHHNSLRKIDQTTACTTAPRVRVCASLDRLRAWHGSLMCKYRLITRSVNFNSSKPQTNLDCRCIDAREYFTERFFGWVFIPYSILSLCLHETFQQ